MHPEAQALHVTSVPQQPQDLRVQSHRKIAVAERGAMECAEMRKADRNNSRLRQRETWAPVYERSLHEIVYASGC